MNNPLSLATEASALHQNISQFLVKANEDRITKVKDAEGKTVEVQVRVVSTLLRHFALRVRGYYLHGALA